MAVESDTNSEAWKTLYQHIATGSELDWHLLESVEVCRSPEDYNDTKRGSSNEEVGDETEAEASSVMENQ